MATNVAPIKSGPAGVDPVMTLPDIAGNDVQNIGNTIVTITTGATAVAVTVKAKQTVRPADAQFAAGVQGDLVLNMLANQTRQFGPFPAAFVNSNGAVEFRYDAVANAKIGAVYSS